MRRHALAMLLLALVAWAVPAAVPHEDAAPAYAEEQTIRQLEQGLEGPGWWDRASGIEHFDRHTIVQPGLQPEYDVILQRGGNTWRALRNEPLAWSAGVLLLGTLALLALYHWRVGPVPPEGTGESRSLTRFTKRQRWIHWAVAATFVVLGISGLAILYGKQTLLPLIGHDAFSWVAIVSKWLHNIAGPLFVLLSLLMFVTYLRHNRFVRADASWLLRLGGMLNHKPPPAPYFNAGEKLWFWLGVTGLGLLMGATGLVLNFPYFGEVGAVVGFTRYQLQWANVLHLVGAALYLAFSFGHIYLGTVGSPGAWHAMWRGTVSESWARTHHRLWYDEMTMRRGAGAQPPR